MIDPSLNAAATTKPDTESGVTSKGVSGRLRDALHRYVLPRRHTALLVAIVFAFSVRPLIGDVGAAPLVFSIALLLLLLVALYTIQVDELVGERNTLLVQKRRRGIVGWVLAAPAIAYRVVVAIAPSRQIFLAGSIFWLLFVSYVTWMELRSVLKQRKVTSETIAMSISVYLLLGLAWGLFYVVLFQVQPNAFNFNGSSNPFSGGPAGIESVFPVLIYFSLTTLSTLGFGDITPMSLQARYSAVAEGITGQFYLAILVARLVGLYMSQSAETTN
jgi:voltage-gated potassium channel